MKTLTIIAVALLAVSVQAVTVELAWDAPTENVDGTPLTDLAGFRVYQGDASGSYTVSTDVGNVLSHIVSGLDANRYYYFAATAYDLDGNESAFSDELPWYLDTIPPTFICPYDVSYEREQDVPPPNTEMGIAEDDHSEVTVTWVGDTNDGGKGTWGNPLTIWREYAATDAAGNTTTCTQTITVRAIPPGKPKNMRNN